MSSHTVTLTSSAAPRPVVDRGPRPFMRGRLHSAAAWYFGGASTALSAVTFAYNGLSWLSFVTVLYSFCLVGMLLVSAVYHRAPWRSTTAVNVWRRADHAMIAVFIAGTYGPVTVAAYGDRFWAIDGFLSWGGTWILGVSWVAALAAVILNVVWINHARWLDAAVYLSLGWLAAIAALGYYQALGVAVSALFVAGGLVYSVGAIIYAKRWPNPSERWFGFHEVFHAATIIAALLHHIGIWLLILH
ncbi:MULTISPECIES: hemolysin III family protein [Corynebacterium]|uniref:PAQR family membrane homeostasis protein TrhA n=1 Tax=Corynebacterium TaxID=1716 RepID=UPI001CE452EA|nr:MULTISPECIES: hemolysin III family protein [Corynebacterium]